MRPSSQSSFPTKHAASWYSYWVWQRNLNSDLVSWWKGLLQEFLRKSPRQGGHQSKKVKGILFRRVLLACGGYGNEVHCKQKWRSPKSESDLVLDSYYQEPHQFCFKVFKDSCTPAEVVLVSGHKVLCGCLVIFFWKTLQHRSTVVQLVLSNSPKLRAPCQKAQNESPQHNKKGYSSQVKKKLCSRKMSIKHTT